MMLLQPLAGITNAVLAPYNLTATRGSALDKWSKSIPTLDKTCLVGQGSESRGLFHTAASQKLQTLLYRCVAVVLTPTQTWHYGPYVINLV